MLFAYIRCSTLEQTNGSTIEDQERVVRGFAMAHGVAASDVQIFVDAGVSGSIPFRERPGGRQIMESVRKGDIICAAKLDRMFRDAIDALTMHKYFCAAGIDVVLYDMGVDSITRDNSLSRFFFMMLSAFADLERVRIRERLRDGKAAKVGKGGHAGGKPPYGFRIVGKGREARLEAVPEEQRLLAFVKDHAGSRTGRLKRLLAAQGFRSRTGRPFDETQVIRLRKQAERLHNGYYQS